MRTLAVVVALALAAPSTACTDSDVDDELAGDDASEGGAGKADEPGGTYTFYLVVADTRRCSPPDCGGVFYRIANAAITTCLDGMRAESCYAASADFTGTGLADTGRTKIAHALSTASLLARATIGTADVSPGLGPYARLDVTEAWIPQGPHAPEGPIARIEDRGIPCVTTSCNPLRERKLNSATTVAIARLDWNESGATDEQITTAVGKMNTTGLIVAGYRRSFTDSAGNSRKARTVSQFWLRATDQPVQMVCYKGGCSDEVCSDRPDVTTICEFLPQYACYHDAACEVQGDGTCGWTQTSELQACLANP